MNLQKFYKNGNGWYIDLPQFIEQGGSIGDLQMVEGADRLLDIISNGRKEVVLNISEQPFENAALMNLKEKCDPVIGGAYYLVSQYNGQEINLTLWLCAVTEFVFGHLPSSIYFKA